MSNSAEVFNRALLLDPQATWVAKVQATLTNVQDGPAIPAIEQLLAIQKVTVTAAIMTR